MLGQRDEWASRIELSSLRRSNVRNHGRLACSRCILDRQNRKRRGVNDDYDNHFHDYVIDDDHRAFDEEGEGSGPAPSDPAHR